MGGQIENEKNRKTEILKFYEFSSFPLFGTI